MSGYIGTQPVPQATQTRDSFTATSNQTSFATSGYTPNFLDVFLNGVKLAAADYTASNGSDVVLATGATTGDILEVVAYTNFDTANVTGAANFTVTGAFTSQGIDDNANATAITIDANENVGIGTSSPTVLLDLESASPIIRLTDSDASGTPECQISGAGGDLIFDADRDNEKASSLMLFKVDGSEAMRIDNSGAVTMPKQPAFLAQPASTQNNFPINAVTTLVMGTERFDQNADFASNTFTAPVTGKYLLNVDIYAQNLDVDTSYYQLDLTTSNRTYYAVKSLSGNDADVTYHNFVINVLADMDANDTAVVRFNIPNSGTAQMDVLGGSSFSGYLAC